MQYILHVFADATVI